MENTKCPVAKKCSGCQLSNLSYEQQLAWKQKDVAGLLGSYSEVSPIIPMEPPCGYRCKVQAVFRSDRSGRIISGVYQSSRNGIVGIDRCMVNDPRADEIIVGIRELMRSFKIRPWDPGTDRGFIKHVLVRIGRNTGEILVTIVGGTSMFPKKRDFVTALVKRFPAIKTVTFSVNRSPDFLTLGDHAEVLFGEGYIIDEICGKKFRISPQSFYQVNPVQAEKLYNFAINAAKLTKNDTLLDAYSGTGTIGIIASDRVKAVQGIEYNSAAVRDAVQNCKLNGITRNAAFNRGDAGEYLRERAKKGVRFDAVIMDPARAGADKQFLRALSVIRPERIVYISCSPVTLARDLRTLTKNYNVECIQPFDMFPFTRHVETVCLLVLRNPVTHINIDVDVEEMVQDKRGLATYEQIKDYVLEHSGLKVSSLYIAQVKQKYGIIERENYNKPKSEDARQPQCPLEKERAITEALKHFGML